MVLSECMQSQGRKSSYYKMDVKLVSNEEIVENIEARWAMYEVEARDPCINWDLAWGAMKTILLKEKKK